MYLNASKSFFPMTSRLMLTALALLVVTLSPLTANVYASDTKTKIERVEIKDTSGLIHVITTSPIRNSPSCDTLPKRMIFATNRDSAKLFLATLLTAITADKSVRLVGTGTCIDRNYIETVEWLSIYR